MQPYVSLSACIIIVVGLPWLLQASSFNSNHRRGQRTHRNHRTHRVDQGQRPARQMRLNRSNGPSGDPVTESRHMSRSDLPEMPLSSSANLADEAGNGKPTACPGCLRERQLQQLDNQLSPEEIRRMRLEIVKKQILEKLGMKKEPNITTLPSLPEPLNQADMMLDDDQGTWEGNDDDYYGKVTQIIIFGNEMRNCHSQRPAGCFRFRIKETLRPSDVASATLWVYKLPDEGDFYNQTLMVQELVGPHHNPSRRLVGEKDTDLRIGWVKVDIKHTVRHWMSKKDRSHGLMVSCKTCYMDKEAAPIATLADFKPFIVINAAPPNRRRQRRSLGQCRQGIPYETQPCCMVPFYVNFTEIYMDSYILRPAGFYANYCQGTCSDSTLGTHMHTQAIQLLGKSTCCGATKLKSISILLLDTDDTAMFKKVNLPKMRLERCGCL